VRIAETYGQEISIIGKRFPTEMGHEAMVIHNNFFHGGNQSVAISGSGFGRETIHGMKPGD